MKQKIWLEKIENSDVYNAYELNESEDGFNLIGEFIPKPKFNKPSVTVDTCILKPSKRGLEILLIKRKNNPYEGHWAFPGGFLDILDNETSVENETLEAAAIRELKEETGLDSSGYTLHQFKTYGDPDRDPRSRVITVVYYAIITDKDYINQEIKANSDAVEVGWFNLEKLLESESMKLAFDHKKILRDLDNHLGA